MLEFGKYYIEVNNKEIPKIFKVLRQHPEHPNYFHVVGFALDAKFRGCAIEKYISSKDDTTQYIEVSEKYFLKLYHLYSVYQESIRLVIKELKILQKNH